jgi:polar amino acid transport system substrate-binding protein
MRNKQGEWMGLEVDVAQALARSMGLEVRFVELPFSDLIPALERDEVDLVISGMTITPERNARVAFAGPYFVSGKSVLTKSDTLARAAVEGRLDQKSRRFAALAGSTSEQFVKDVFPEATLVPVPEYNAGIQGVLDGSVDALIADYPICGLAVLRYPNAGLVALTTPFTIEPLGIALPASDPLWVNLVQNYLSTLENTGLLTRLHARWFSQGDWIDELP